MFKIDNTKKIYMNRGDTLYIKLKNDTDIFYAGDIITFSIMTKGDSTDVLLTKTYTVTAAEEGSEYEFVIASADTKGPNFPAIKQGFETYWYEIELNSDGEISTLIGADTEGPKLFCMYPEAVNSQQNNN